MKKLLLIFCILASIFGSSIFAQTWVEDVYLNEDFSTATGSWVDGTLTQGYWTGATQSTTNTFTSAVNTTNKNVEIKTNVKIGNRNPSFVQKWIFVYCFVEIFKG